MELLCCKVSQEESPAPGLVSSSLHGSRFLAGELGGSITHQCFYSTTPANKYERKYWCKISASGVCYTIVSSRFISSEYRGRVALGDVPQNGTFTVTMTGLRSNDSGTYRCGIGSTNEGLYVSLNLTVLADAPVSRPTQLIRGELHSSVTVLCPSGDTQRDQKRFWCKVGRSSCTLMASSDGFVSRRYQGRIVISPQESSGAFKVLLNDLKKDDSGLYLCGTQGLRGQESPQEVVLQVATASTLPRRPKFLSATVGGSVSFQCHHDPKGTYKRKYLCRWEAGSCQVLLDHQGFVLESHQGRIQMSSSDPGSSTVVLRQLREEDEGWYWCGASSGHTELTAPLKLLIHKGSTGGNAGLEVQEYLNQAGSATLDTHCEEKQEVPGGAWISSPVFGPRQLHGVLGSSVTVKCFYPATPANKHDRKYWCRQVGSRCNTVVSTDYVAPAYQGRISLSDHPEAENFQINISALALGDAGTFQCGLGVNGRGLSHTVTLSVAEAPPVPEAAELFYVKLRSTWSVSCSFGKDTADQRRYLCKKEKEGCRNIINSHREIDPDFQGRALLTFEEPPGSFSVTMTQMDWEDTGLYYCGAGEYGKEGKSKELDVFVYEDKNFPQLKTTVTGKNGSSATFECLYDPLKKSSTRIWCKWRLQGCDKIIDNTGFVKYGYEGRVAMFENPENQTVTIILNQLQAKDEGFYWCLSNELKEQQSSTELKVVKGEPALTGTKQVEARVGSRVNLTCSYPCKYNSYEKYWCRWNYTGCAMLPAQEQGLPGPEASCDTSTRTAVLSFDPLQEEDEGWYWCGGAMPSTAQSSWTLIPAVNSELLPQEEPTATLSSSSAESHGSNTVALVLGPLAGLILIAVTAFAIVKYRQLKRSDLVSVGSYRTNISMSDFENVRDLSASSRMKESQETPMGGDEFITTTDTQESAADTTKAKRSSKEDAELTYSSFLATSERIAQGSSGGDSAVLDLRV
ncbi:Polymeric immunoglobulin receptor, partial [Lamprotornis superbus]